MRIALVQEPGAVGSIELVDTSTVTHDHLTEQTPEPVLGSGTLASPGDAPVGGEVQLERRLRRALGAGPIGGGASAPGQQPASVRSLAEAAVLDRLNVALAEWVDEKKAVTYADSPSELLLAVARHRRCEIPDAFKATLDPTLLADEAVLDEAAVLYDRLHQTAANAGASSGPRVAPTLSALRGTFLNALSNDYVNRQMLDALFVPSPSLGQCNPYFDGFALRNAEGLTFETLLTREEVWSEPALSVLAPAERRELLARKFDEMGESTRFPIGSTAHSLATAVLRIARYRGAEAIDTGQEADVLAAFAKYEGAWSEGDSYPYHPRLLFAAHLAGASGFEAILQEQLRWLYEKHVRGPALELMARGEAGPADWLGRHLGGYGAGGKTWKANPVRRTQALLWLFDALRSAADEEGSVSVFARDLKAKGILTPNRFVGADAAACASAVLEYGNERLIMDYGRPPSFDRRETASVILRRLGVDEDALSDVRPYVIAGDNPNLSKSAVGDIVDEFLDRTDWVGLIGGSMTLPGGKRVTPRDELQREEDAFNERLRSDPWVVAAAKARLRARSKTVTPENVRESVEHIAANLATETESHRALVRGFETWVNTVPVVGPAYNIEEGVRHRDATRAAFGLVFLGVDLFDLAAGGGPRARSEATHPIVPKLRRILGHLDASRVKIAAQPEMIELSVDPVRIAQPDADVPAQLRELAASARAGRRVTWRDYDIVHLELEDRIIPVSRDGERYREVDWRTHRRLYDAPVIDIDAATGKASARAEPPPQPEARPERVGTAQERMTVKGVTTLLHRADDMALRNFDELFADAFVHRAPPANVSRFDAPAFYRKLYESSDTFRRLFNRHADVDAKLRNGTANAGRKWEFVIGEAGPLGAPRKAYTDLEHSRIYMPGDEDINAALYASALGPQPLTREQAYLHEMILAVTGGRDPKTGFDVDNRGPIVYLTDKILAEAGFDIPEQIMARRRDSTSDLPADELLERNASAAMRSADDENRYLDALLDADRGAVTESTLVQGVPVSSRLTVAGTHSALQAIEGMEDDVFLAWSDFKAKFDRQFGFYIQNRTMTAELASDARVITEFYGRLYQRSATFRQMFDEMPANEAARAGRWKFVLEGDIDFQALSPGARVHGATQSDKKIYVLDDGMRYLSESGLREVEFERNLAYQMICAMTGLGKVPAPQSYANRGAAVYLTDRILKEAGFNYPRQLVAALAGPTDAAAQADLLARRTAAMRSAWAEDRYLVLA